MVVVAISFAGGAAAGGGAFPTPCSDSLMHRPDLRADSGSKKEISYPFVNGSIFAISFFHFSFSQIFFFFSIFHFFSTFLQRKFWGPIFSTFSRELLPFSFYLLFLF